MTEQIVVDGSIEAIVKVATDDKKTPKEKSGQNTNWETTKFLFAVGFMMFWATSDILFLISDFTSKGFFAIVGEHWKYSLLINVLVGIIGYVSTVKEKNNDWPLVTKWFKRLAVFTACCLLFTFVANDFFLKRWITAVFVDEVNTEQGTTKARAYTMAPTLTEEEIFQQTLAHCIVKYGQPTKVSLGKKSYILAGRELRPGDLLVILSTEKCWRKYDSGAKLQKKMIHRPQRWEIESRDTKRGVSTSLWFAMESRKAEVCFWVVKKPVPPSV